MLTANRQKMDKQTELQQFRKEPSYDVVYLPIMFELDWTKHFRVRVRK